MNEFDGWKMEIYWMNSLYFYLCCVGIVGYVKYNLWYVGTGMFARR